MKTVSQCKDVVELIIGLEAEELRVNTIEELERVKDLCKKLSSSQGFYGRMLRDLQEIDEYDLPIVL
jgi:hypothetical protein